MESSPSGESGSEASYESVASEGGLEPASERGRDPLPRIISSSNCVQVFGRVRWLSWAYCCHCTPSDEEKAREKAAAATRQGPYKQLRPHNPLSNLPNKILCFDGAMEAWLEEMPLSKGDPQQERPPYQTLNDAGAGKSTLRLGNKKATLWFFTMEFLQQLWPLFLQPDGTGLKLWKQALLDRGCTIQSTHIKVGQIDAPPLKNGLARRQWLTSVFAEMQASKWTPDGEARSFLAKKRLSHASMSIGDAIQVRSTLYVAGLTGFIHVKEGAQLLPPCAEPEEGDEPEEDADAESVSLDEEPADPAEQNGKKARNSGKGGKDGGKGKAKGKGAGEGEGQGRGQQRAKEPAPAGKAAGGGDQRVDRRKLRAQLQAKRLEVQGC